MLLLADSRRWCSSPVHISYFFAERVLRLRESPELTGNTRKCVGGSSWQNRAGLPMKQAHIKTRRPIHTDRNRKAKLPDILNFIFLCWLTFIVSGKQKKTPAVVRLTGNNIIKSFPRNLIDVHVKIQCSKSEIVFTRRTWPSADNILSKNLICCGLPLEIIKTEIPRGPVVTTPC